MSMILDTENVIWPRNLQEYYNDQFSFLAAFVEWYPQSTVDHVYEHIEILGIDPESCDNAYSSIMQLFDDFIEMNPTFVGILVPSFKILNLDSENYRESQRGDLEWVLLDYQ